MWRKIEKHEEEEYLKIAVEFTGNHVLYGEAMLNVVNDWKYSCENFLTNKGINRRAWIGHAACSLAKNLPEYIVRQAWGMLTEQQRYLANLAADRAISVFESKRTLNKNQLTLW